MTIPEAPAPEQTEVGCPYCSSPLRQGQDWCLSCGAAVTTQVAGSSGWRAPIAIVGVVLLLAASGLVFAFLAVSDDADRQVAQSATPTATPATAVPGVVTPVPGATPAPSAVPPIVTPGPVVTPVTPGETPTPAATPATTVAPSGTVGSWPAGKDAYTVILLSTRDKPSAQKRAETLAGQGTSVGVLNSSDYSSLRPGYWVVFSGQYESAAAAKSAADGLRAKAPQAYPREIKN